jgi:hypothetical protein
MHAIEITRKKLGDCGKVKVYESQKKTIRSRKNTFFFFISFSHSTTKIQQKKHSMIENVKNTRIIK